MQPILKIYQRSENHLELCFYSGEYVVISYEKVVACNTEVGSYKLRGLSRTSTKHVNQSGLRDAVDCSEMSLNLIVAKMFNKESKVYRTTHESDISELGFAGVKV